jgi:hypothetical protein
MSRVPWFLILAVAATVCLGGTEASLVSGQATAYESGKEVQHVTLTTDQLQVLFRWLKQRQGGWGAHITEPSSEPVSISLDLTRADGEVDHLGVIAAARGGHYMRLSVGPGIRWAYRSFGGILKTRYAQQSINESELATLGQVLFRPSTP